MTATTLGRSQKPSSRVNQNALLTNPSVTLESTVLRSRAGWFGKLTTSRESHDGQREAAVQSLPGNAFKWCCPHDRVETEQDKENTSDRHDNG